VDVEPMTFVDDEDVPMVEQDAAEAALPEDDVLPFYHEPHHKLGQEMLNVFEVDTIVDFAPGSGNMMRAVLLENTRTLPQPKEPRAQGPEARAQSPETGAQSPEPRTQGLEPIAQRRGPRAQSREPRSLSSSGSCCMFSLGSCRAYSVWNSSGVALCCAVFLRLLQGLFRLEFQRSSSMLCLFSLGSCAQVRSREPPAMARAWLEQATRPSAHSPEPQAGSGHRGLPHGRAQDLPHGPVEALREGVPPGEPCGGAA